MRARFLVPAAVAAACLTAAAPAAAQSPGCPAGYECGALTVPLDRAAPGGATTQVAYALKRHGGPGPAAGTIVPNPGGPGGAVIAGAAQYQEALGRDVLATRDLLLIDPRGVGRSDALDCGLPDDALAPGRDIGVLTGRCAATLGPDRANAYGTAAVADDFDAVRATLGISQVDLWGQSYGTYLFTVYARRHAEHVRSMVLSGAYAPTFDTWARDRSRALRNGFTLVCERSERCSGRAVVRDVKRLVKRLDRTPLRFEAKVIGRRRALRLDGAALADLAYATYEDAARFGILPKMTRAALKGRTGPLVAYARAMAQNTPR